MWLRNIFGTSKEILISDVDDLVRKRDVMESPYFNLSKKVKFNLGVTLISVISLVVPLTFCIASDAAALVPTWGDASLIPGITQLNVGNFSNMSFHSISCTSSGSCSAGGTYKDANGGTQGFVADQVNGVWTNAEEIPGLGSMHDGAVSVTSVSCASPGNCSAGGSYEFRGNVYGYLVNEVSGTWETAETVGIASLGPTVIDAVSCSSDGNCTAGGSYVAGLLPSNFIMDESNGTWGVPVEVPNLSTLNFGAVGNLVLSCSTAGNCSASSTYTDGSNHVQGYVASERSGVWDGAQEIPGLGVLNSGNELEVASISCASPGNCSAGGNYYSNPIESQAFVVNQVDGTWNSAEIVPGSQQLNAGNSAVLLTLSCSTPGYCSAGGGYTLADGITSEVFVVDEINGTWGNAQEIPGSQSLNTAGYAVMNAISCCSPGNCSAGGDYNIGNPTESFLADEVDGVWGHAIQVPGSLALGVGSGANSLSCSHDNYCAATGNIGNGTGNYFQPFVVSRYAAVPVTPIFPAVQEVSTAKLAATGSNLTLPLGLATALLGLGCLSVLEAQRRRRGA